MLMQARCGKSWCTESVAKICFRGEGGGERGGGREGRGIRRGGGAGGSSIQNLHAIVEGVSHDDAPVAVDGDAALRAVEQSVA